MLAAGRLPGSCMNASVCLSRVKTSFGVCVCFVLVLVCLFVCLCVRVRACMCICCHNVFVWT